MGAKVSAGDAEITVVLTKMQAAIVLHAIEQGMAVHPSDAVQIAERIRAAAVARDADRERELAFIGFPKGGA